MPDKLYYVLTSQCSCAGTTDVLGVFESMDALTARLQWVCDCDDDKYTIEGFALSTKEDQEEQRDEILARRAEYAKERLEKIAAEEAAA